jgi:hypothetical protein
LTSRDEFTSKGGVKWFHETLGKTNEKAPSQESDIEGTRGKEFRHSSAKSVAIQGT